MEIYCGTISYIKIYFDDITKGYSVKFSNFSRFEYEHRLYDLCEFLEKNGVSPESAKKLINTINDLKWPYNTH